ncbi:MAG TPA: RMD1 family protein, partial [Polyangiaceae bacterium]|nr:RMD1 family protein [Polyangiaceae bacterium]
VVGDVLAKSVALEHYERHIAETFDQLEPLTTQLASTGKTGRRSRVLVRHIASSLLAEHHLMGRIEVVEKPDLLWEHPRLERLHAWLVREYEIKERQIALERKLHLLSRTAQVLLDLLQTRRSLRVEWYVVVLIVVEVVLMLAFEWP